MKSKNVSRKFRNHPSKESTEHKQKLQLRSVLALVLILCFCVVLVVRFIYLQLEQSDRLQREGDKRFEYNLGLPAKRGEIFDRKGELLATSVAAADVYVEPQLLKQADEASLKQLAKLLDLSYAELRSKRNLNRKVVLLKRQIISETQESIKDLKIKGISFESNAMRSYPLNDLFVHWIGFTDIDGKGAAGLELVYNEELKGESGLQQGLRNRMGEIIDVQAIVPARDGQSIRLTADRRLQKLTQQVLKEAVSEHRARAGTALVVDVQTGDVLAMVSLPDYDANQTDQRKGEALRNRAIMDALEVGSVMKPLVAALALDSGVIDPTTMIDTGDGTLRYEGKTITDVSRNKGMLDIAGILKHSSNVGMVKIAERLSAEQMWTVFDAFGFGKKPMLAYPGVTRGSLRPYAKWKRIEKATMAYGYGLSVSLLQLAQAYTALARNGEMIALHLRSDATKPPKTIQIYSKETASQVLSMLEGAASSVQKHIPDFRIAGKSGTARKLLKSGGYSQDDYYASFVGIAPVSQPRLLVAVTIEKSRRKGEPYFGGQVSGPIVAKIMAKALGTLGVPPDRHPTVENSKEKP